MPRNSRLPAPIATPSALSPEIAQLAEDAAYLIEQARSANTRRAYKNDWVDFCAWCAKHQTSPMPAHPHVVALYITDLAKGGRARRPKRVSTIERRLAAIAHYHRANNQEYDAHERTLRETWAGLRRTYTRAPKRKVATVTEFLRLLVATCPTDTLIGLRDRALLLVGFAGCFRRAELVSLNVEDCAIGSEGVIISLRRSKTDQEGEGSTKGLPYGAHIETCPVRALTSWLDAAAITEGPVFRPITRHRAVLPQRLSAGTVATIVKRAVTAARANAIAAGQSDLAKTLDPKNFAGHSLRAGFITSAAAVGVSESDIMRQSGHKRADTLRKYVRHATVFRQNAAAKVGL